MSLEHVRIQYGVGQGTFHAAHVEYTDSQPKQWRFDYVYDCGALEAGRPSRSVQRSLEHYEPRAEGDETVIDALILSHYDCDHINGAKWLADKHKVRQIYLPYLSPDQLVLEIARCAEGASDSTMQALFAGAHGNGLWGSEVIRVRRGERPAGPGGPVRLEELPRAPRPNESSTRENDGGTPLEALRPVLAKSGALIPSVLDDHEAVGLADGAGSQVWYLKFWNYCLDDAELSFNVALLLGTLGFPVHALETPGGADEVLSWLQKKTNRTGAVAVYRAAIDMYSGGCTYLPHIANLISLGAFSGPIMTRPNIAEYTFADYSASTWLYPWQLTIDRAYGWLGTGDALLGEQDVWDEFSTHYHHELDAMHTVLIPHHGAAPRSGPKFYNAMLNREPGTLTVISAGAHNNYGHPRLSVLKNILQCGGVLHVVTEHSFPGLVERLFWAAP
jgi:hypothetical protein